MKLKTFLLGSPSTGANRAILTVASLGLCVFSAMAQKTETLYLSGYDADHTRKWDFSCTKGTNSGKWRKIAVPSCWELQGFGEYTYGRYYKRQGLKASDEQGTYRTKFSIPQNWKDKKVEIVFEGVMTDALVKVNGQVVGDKHQGGFTSFSYDVTPFITSGKKNSLEVVVDKQSANKSVNAAERRADWWLFGGIYRPVYLRALPQVSISQALIDARADGYMTVRLTTHGKMNGYQLRAAIDGVGERMIPLSDHSQQTISTAFLGIVPWNPEQPRLYSLKLSLIDKQGKVVHETSERIGFRTLEFRRRDGFYLNGTRLQMKGINRHCFYPETGRTTSKERDINDVKLIKGMNANAIRSHYPPDKHLLDICDSLGVLYLEELPGWQNCYDTTVGTKILTEMITHDANHPCIFVWSNGNEGGNNFALDSLFTELDPQKRHVVHPWALWNGVDTHHYPAYQTGIARLANGYEVFMPTEFLHAQYDKGGGASLDDFWNSYKRNPLFAGGFIWAFADEGIVRTDRKGYIDTDQGFAPDGIVGPHREKEASWYTIRDVWSPIQIAPVAIRSHWDGRLLLTNDYLFTPLSACQMTYQVLDIAKNGQRTVKSEGTVRLPNIKPGASDWVDFAQTHALDEGDFLQLAALNHQGDTINKWSFPLRYADEYHQRHHALALQDEATAPTSSQAECASVSAYTLSSANGLSVTFDEKTGMLTSVVKRGKVIPFANGPVAVGFKAQLKGIRSRMDGKDAILTMYYTGGTDSIVWRMTPEGQLGMDALILNRRDGGHFEGPFFDSYVSALGFSFSYPESEVKGMTWLGRGPYRVWRNRQRGMLMDLWHKAYNNTVTGEGKGKPLTYPEFKGYHANVYWAQLESDQYPLSIESETDGLYLRVFTPEEPEGAMSPTMQPFPEGDISLLLDIPAIQSYKPIAQLGPQAQPANIRINKGDEGLHIKVWFKF